jgi:hypothetical protein
MVLSAMETGAQPLILNEFNAVGSSRFLDGENTDTRLGRIEGNGGNWIELVVIEDHADVRGLELRWAEESTETPAQPVWDDSRPLMHQGVIRFLDHEFWSDLRQGTIITITESGMLVDDQGSTVVDGSDLQIDPGAGDWWVNVWSFDTDLLEVITNVPGDFDGNFSVGNDNWEISLFDNDGELLIWGPIGEAYDGFGGGVGSDEVGKLEFDPSADVTIFDYNDGTSSSFGAPNIWSAGTITQDFSLLREWALNGNGNGGGTAPLSIAVVNGEVQLSWERLPGLEYELQQSSSITAPQWERVSFYPMIMDDSVNHSETVATEPGQLTGFFQVLVSDPQQ